MLPALQLVSASVLSLTTLPLAWASAPRLGLYLPAITGDGPPNESQKKGHPSGVPEYMYIL